MISNASIQCCKINSLPLIQLLCLVIQNFSKGSILGPKGDDPTQALLNYCALCFYRTASIMANGCQGIAYLANGDIKKSYNYGKHLGMALSVVSDIKDIMNDKIQYSSFPVLFAAMKYPSMQELIVNKQFNIAKELIFASNGIEWARKLALHHIEDAIKAAQEFKNPNDLVSLAANISQSL